MVTCRLDTKDDTSNGKNIVRLPVPARIAAPFSPDECLSDVTHRVDAAPTDNATTVIPAKERSEPHSKEGPLVIPAREQPESSSKDGSQFPLPIPVAWTQRSKIGDQATAHPGSQLRSAWAPERADDDRSQKAAAVIPIKDGSESHSKEGPLVIPAKEQPESSSRHGSQFPLPTPVAWMERSGIQDQATAHPELDKQYHPATRAADFPLQNDTTTVIPAKGQPESSSREGDSSPLPSSITFNNQQNGIKNPPNTHPTFRYPSTRRTNQADYRSRHRLKTLIPTTPKPNSKRTPPCKSTLANDVTRQRAIST